MKKKRRLKIKNIILLIIIIICLTLLIIASINIIKWIIETNKTNNDITNIQEKINIEEISDNGKTEIIEQDEIDEFDPYWDYIKMNLINVDFNELKNINKETKGWIQVNGTNINYPFVQADNNDFYLSHSLDKSYNTAGWVFLDYKNNLAIEDKNTIIYAHGRMDNTMFGSLRKILTSGWLNNSKNYIIKLSTEYENTLWQVFSVYRIPTTNDYLQITFNNNDDFLEFATKLMNRSNYNFNTTINKNDRILTLSTCYNDKDKVVLHAKLIKKEKK